MFRCTICGYIHDGQAAPEKCPKCNAPQEKFEEVMPEDQEKIQRSRFTNNLHMELKMMLDSIVELAEDGITDNLDPSCVKIFKEARIAGIELGQKVKAELQGHMTKGKWG